MPETMSLVMDILNYCFTVYFVIETNIRMIGLGPDLFFGTFMNRCATFERAKPVWIVACSFCGSLSVLIRSVDDFILCSSRCPLQHCPHLNTHSCLLPTALATSCRWHRCLR